MKEFEGSTWFGPFVEMSKTQHIEELVIAFNTVTHKGIVRGLSLVLHPRWKCVYLYYRDGSDNFLGLKAYSGGPNEPFFERLIKIDMTQNNEEVPINAQESDEEENQLLLSESEN